MNTDTEPKRMKLWKKILIGVGGTLILLGIALAVILTFDVTWYLLLALGGVSFVVWVIIATILIYQKIIKKEPEVIRVNLEDAEELVKYRMKYDEDNPDNFIIKERRLWKMGEPG